MSYEFYVQAQDQENAPELRYEFTVDDKGVPLKLGDGTFGSVFEGRDPEEKQVAIKLFYPEPDNRRNRLEMKSGLQVRRKLREVNQERLISNLVLSRAWTTRFRCSQAFKKLSGKFDELGVSVSNDALVMPLYESTLKDVLEGGPPTGRIVGGRFLPERGAPGYDVIRNLSITQREKHIVGIVGQIVTGLRALHAAGLFHHDIKPANVMMNSTGDNVEVALGDFGFLEPSPVPDKTGYAGGLALGTRHYRSPEQKDFFDLCDVKVTFSSEDGLLHLETSDAKFRDTLIENGDLAVFSKDAKKTGYAIESVMRKSEQRTKIVLRARKCVEAADDKTQVVFYKRSSPRTDMFGVGAILFDLLTAGKSPESFYDYLRPFDRPEEEGGATVRLMVERYRAAAGANSMSADLAPLVDQLRDDAQAGYPSAEIVSILLKCMLCRVVDSYCQEARKGDGEIDGNKLFGRVQHDLAEVTGQAAISTLTNNNPLWVGKRSNVDRLGFTTGFFAALEAAKDMPKARRLVWGALKFRQLVSAVNKNAAYFADLGPANLRFDERSSDAFAIIEGYETADHYLRAVRTGSAWRMDTIGDNDNFVPLYRRFDVRCVDVAFMSDQEEETSDWDKDTSDTLRVGRNVIDVRVRFTDSLPIWRGTRKGDFLRVLGPQGLPMLFRVLEPSTSGVWKKMKIEVVSSDEDGTVRERSDPDGTEGGDVEASEGLVVPRRTRGVLINRLFSMGYYMSMMATYVHHLFFADRDQDDGTIPDVVWSGIHTNVQGELGDVRKKLEIPEGWFGKNKTQDLAGVRRLLAMVYLDLLLHGEDRGTDTTREGMYARLLRLQDVLDDAVGKLCGVGDRFALRALKMIDIEGAVDEKVDHDWCDDQCLGSHVQDILKPKKKVLRRLF